MHICGDRACDEAHAHFGGIPARAAWGLGSLACRVEFSTEIVDIWIVGLAGAQEQDGRLQLGALSGHHARRRKRSSAANDETDIEDRPPYRLRGTRLLLRCGGLAGYGKRGMVFHLAVPYH